MPIRQLLESSDAEVVKDMVGWEEGEEEDTHGEKMGERKCHESLAPQMRQKVEKRDDDRGGNL